MLFFVNLASAMCMLTMFGLSACIFILLHTLFFVGVAKSAISATYMQTVRSRHVIFTEKWFGPLWFSYPFRQNCDCSGMKTTEIFITFSHPVSNVKSMRAI